MNMNTSTYAYKMSHYKYPTGGLNMSAFRGMVVGYNIFALYLSYLRIQTNFIHVGYEYVMI